MPHEIEPWSIEYCGREIHGLGEAALLGRARLGIICSVQCPGEIVIHTLDVIRELRDAGVVVIGGFHSPMEQECLEILLRGRQAVIVALAKGLNPQRLPDSWSEALKDQRLLLISGYGPGVRRISKAQARERNLLIVELSESLFVPYAQTGGGAEQAVEHAKKSGKEVYDCARVRALLFHRGASLAGPPQ